MGDPLSHAAETVCEAFKELSPDDPESIEVERLAELVQSLGQELDSQEIAGSLPARRPSCSRNPLLARQT
jgi:hypothetical protein